MRPLRSALAALLVALPAPAVAQQAPAAPPVVTVAVFPLTGIMLDGSAQSAQLAETFRSMVVTELSAAGRLGLVERQMVDSLLQAQAISTSGMVSDAQAITIGQLLGAQYAVAGAITIDARDARLDLRLIDIETGEVTTFFKDVVKRDRLLSLVDRVAQDFGGRAQVKARVVDVEVPVPAAFAYSRGLDFEKRGRKQDAAAMFRRALELFPQHPHARAALQRVN